MVSEKNKSVEEIRNKLKIHWIRGWREESSLKKKIDIKASNLKRIILKRAIKKFKYKVETKK
jgi:hypothetical protein